MPPPASPPETPHRLAEVPLFARLPAAALAELAAASRLRRYPAGQVLWSEGDDGEALAVVEAGQLRVSRFAASGAEVVLAVVEAPAALGELALLDGQPRDATVTAQGPVAVRLVPRGAFRAVLERDSSVALGLVATLAGWVRQANRRHADLLGLDVPGRLAKWLLGRTGDATGAGVTPGVAVALGRSQAELAAELGTTRESLNRALRGFVELGLIVVEGDRVRLVEPDSLAAYTG